MVPQWGCVHGGRDGSNQGLPACCGYRGGLVFKVLNSCITELMAQGTSRTCNESKEEKEEEEVYRSLEGGKLLAGEAH